MAHLGNGASISAIRNGKCLDTSMGLTPTGGIISGTRTGDIDPGVLIFILRKIAETTPDTGAAADKLETVAARRSGLLGVSELSNDMRDLREAIKDGNAKARLAVDKFTWTIAKWIGSYVAELGGLDMLVFTGGIGENDIASRAEICAGLGALGIVLDPARNNVRGEADLRRNLAGHGARDPARRRSDDREPCGAPAGRIKESAVALRTAHRLLAVVEQAPLFYTEKVRIRSLHSCIPSAAHIATKRLPSPALRRFRMGACWHTSSP